MFGKLLADYQLIALQETKFTKADNLRVVTSYINSADSKAQVFWSQHTDNDFTGRNGVALILSGSHPFTSVENVTPRYASAAQQPRYLVLDAKIENLRFFIHAVYAPVTVAERKRFFTLCPPGFRMRPTISSSAISTRHWTRYSTK
ncbi:hypothetical protein PHYPSEUDO_000656 [Phytophthora pseudosyringae]|uniref:Endonuclease/exonuclease/phosphatase domain-containing protein n=1 Tax=Phytophthora pseudosyringae TaxID=221518 RepID=A0A8T1V5B5_9STRA|nr:hypothetical protein PHYPSEUDO_000656 [Phytophthora pseudosyringae]